MGSTDAGARPFTLNAEEETAARTTTVRLRSIVEIEWDDGVRGVYRIGAESESDPNSKVIGADAPVAAAITGACEGDIRRYMVRGGWRSVTVLSIHSEEGETDGC
jgi:transcription elongation GreA/GreB family factor